MKEFPVYKDQISYATFFRIFDNERNISIGYPRSDLCETCDSLQAKICAVEAEKNDEAVKKLTVEKELHNRQAAAFYETQSIAWWGPKGWHKSGNLYGFPKEFATSLDQSWPWVLQAAAVAA